MKRITRTPGVTFTWMVFSVLYVLVLFSRWEALKSPHTAALWWTSLLAFLTFDYLFLITPVREKNALRVLSRRGKAWAAIAWLTVCVFLWIVVPGTLPAFRKQHPLLIASTGLLFLLFLVFALLRFRLGWQSTPLRSIVAGEAGGFIVRFPATPELTACVSQIPGALPTPDPNAWTVPAQGDAAAALLRFAKSQDFDFIP